MAAGQKKRSRRGECRGLAEGLAQVAHPRHPVSGRALKFDNDARFLAGAISSKTLI